jgi:hypothetical protein
MTWDMADDRTFRTPPNKALELTGKKLALFPSSSPGAFGREVLPRIKEF